MYQKLYRFVSLTFGIVLISFSISFAQDRELKFDRLTVDEGLSQNSVFSITKDKFGFMWFATWEGVCRFDGYLFKVFRADENNPYSITNNRVNVVYTDSLGDIWVQTADPHFVFKYNYQTEDFSRFPQSTVNKRLLGELLKKRGVRSVSAKGYRWDIMPKGILQTDLKYGRSTSYLPDFYNPWALSDATINTLYLDNNEILWIGTQHQGICKADLNAKPFRYYYSSPGNANSLVSNVVRAVCEDVLGNIWVGYDQDGISVIDRKTGRYSVFTASSGLSDNNIRTIYSDKLGFVWIGTKGGLDRFDSRSRSFKHYRAGLAGGIPDNWVFAITEDRAGSLWIGTYNGIAKYDRKKDNFFAFGPDSTLKGKNVRAILEDHKRRLWVATEGGGFTIFRRDSIDGIREKLTPEHHQKLAASANSLLNNTVLTMAEDNTGMVWLGTNSGLSRFDPEKQQYTNFSVKNGFPDDLIMGLMCDSKHNLWVSHKRGLTRIDVKSLSMAHYNKHDGIQGNEFNQNAFYLSKRTGEMFFGGTNGLNSFFPDSIKENPFDPIAVITSVQVLNKSIEIGEEYNGRKLLPKSLLFTDEIKLEWGEKSFSIDFSSLHFSNIYGNQFKYKLGGFDRDWIFTSSTLRRASYSSLAPGKYVFEVYASNSDGRWSLEPAKLSIVVLPPWWRTWVAYFGYLLILACIFWLILKYMSSRVKLQNQLEVERMKAEKEYELNQLKMQFYTNISHEFRTPLSLIIDPLERLSKGQVREAEREGMYELMLRNSKRLLRLINQLLDFRKVEAGYLKVELQSGDIVKFVKEVFENCRYMAVERGIDYTFECPSGLAFAEFDPDKVEKIVYNLLSNAIKFTPSGGEITLNISFMEEDETQYVEIAVSDTGRGIPTEEVGYIFEPFYRVTGTQSQDREGTGVGLAFVKELVSLHRGEIIVETELGRGACFRVRLPFIHTDVDKLAKFPDIITDDAFLPPYWDGSGVDSAPIILIVEDDNDIRYYVRNYLSQYFTVHESSNGSDGYQKAIDIIPDLIISDIAMPEMDGLTLCKMLKTDERTSHIPVVLLTAKQTDTSQIEGFETGADEYIPKPFSTEVLLARVKNLIASRQKLRELYQKDKTQDVSKLASNATDEAFVNRLTAVIIQNIEETEFSTDLLAESLKLSRTQLYRKVKALTNQTVHDFVLSIKLNKATELLLNSDFTIAEIAYKVGFSLPTNFTRSFVKVYGQTPSEYRLAHSKI